MEIPINGVFSVPTTFNLPEENSTEWFELYKTIWEKIKEKYNGHKVDICSTDMYDLGHNLIFKYRVVPTWAPTMSSYPYYYVVIIKEQLVEKL